MPIISELPPLGLYIHLPWCVQKCPYCDFNSHEMQDSLPQEIYVNALLQDLDQHLPLLQNRQFISVFFGGGTPSLFSPQMIARILDGIQQRVPFSPGTEITLEANPGTIDAVRFVDFRKSGINRISLGLQSLQDEKLKALGRIHDSEQAKRAIVIAKEAGFANFNLDLMYGLPNQTLEDALHDLRTALSFQPTHLSWYQLTIEPNTVFYKHTPVLPHDDAIYDIQIAGQALLKQHGLDQYEVSAYARNKQECLHNRNYWEFGDYVGIGAGAHSKITCLSDNQIIRFAQVKQPRDYLDKSKRRDTHLQTLSTNDLVFEFMLNGLRLTQGVPVALFTKRTGLPLQQIQAIVDEAQKRELLMPSETQFCPTEKGRQYLNNLVAMFL